ncbi:MAG: hypothetical protein A2Y38_05760 [Spirochaetes bacterium GWB1_59_5]|nr:MAG: hypothetical protein A2Y38_05760 [Spirochaetes bacterium GWB1_59_5]
MIGERLPLDTRTAQAVRRVVRLHDDDPAAARIAARALATGLDPEGVAVRKVLGVLDAPDSGGSEGSFSGGSSFSGSSAGEDGDRERRSGITATPLETPEPSADSAEIQSLVTRLKSAARSAMEDPDLRALAAPSADGAGWACIPFDIPFAGINFHGFFRILYYGTIGSARKLIADIRFGDERRLLELSGSGLNTVASYYADDVHERLAFDTEFGGIGKEIASNLAAGDFSELSSRWSVDEDV